MTDSDGYAESKTGWGPIADEHLAANPQAYAWLASFVTDMCQQIQLGAEPQKVCDDIMEYAAKEEPVKTWLSERTPVPGPVVA